MLKNKIALSTLLILLGTVACQPARLATETITPSQTNLPTLGTPTLNPATKTQGIFPIHPEMNTWTPGPTMTSTRTPIPMPDLHTAGPYLFLSGQNSITGYFHELDGSGRRQVNLPTDFGVFSPDRKWYAYFIGKVDSSGVYPAGGLVLHLLNPLTGKTRDIAKMIPEDFVDRQKELLQEIESRYPLNSNNDSQYPFSLESVIDSLVKGLDNISWSPDGRFLAFPAMIDGNSTDAYYYDIDTRKIIRMDNGLFNVSSMQWSPDSQHLLLWEELPAVEDRLPFSLRIVHRNNLPPTTISEFSINEIFFIDWISNTQFLLSYWTDGGISYSLQVVNAVTGGRSMIWNNGMRSYAVDKVHQRIIISQVDYSSEPGIYSGPLFGIKSRIADGTFADLVFRGGKVHNFIFTDENGQFEGLGSDGKLDPINAQMDKSISVSPDFRWFVSYGTRGLTLFNESDQNVFEENGLLVYGLVWKTNSQGFYFMTYDEVYFLSMAELKLRLVFKCFPHECVPDDFSGFFFNGYSQDNSWVLTPGVSLSSLSSLRVHLPSIGVQTQGNTLWSKAAFKDLSEPGTNEYSVTIPAYSEWRWDFAWCAKDQAGLEKILSPLDIGFSIGGEKVGEDIFRTYDSAKGGRFCRTWATLLSGWQPGDKTDLEIRYSLSSTVSDGKTVYPAGEYRQIIHITIN